MKTLLTANLSTRVASVAGNAWEPPVLTFGEPLTLALRFLEERDGAQVEPNLEIVATRAVVGPVDARPESGRWALQVGPGAQTAGNTTGLLHADCSAKDVQDAIAAKAAVVTAYGAPVVTKEDGAWRIVFGAGGASVPVKVVNNSLFPVSLGRVSAYAVDGVWRQDVRLVQAPVAGTSTAERVLPPPPSVERLQAGGSEGGNSWNELQRLTVPPDFRGTYILRFGDNQRTGELSVSDTVETVQAALDLMLGAGNTLVTNPLPYIAHIEFTGELEGAEQELLEVEPMTPPPGDLTFTIDFDRAELAVPLMRARVVTLPLEVRFRVEGETKWRVAFRQDITIQAPVHWPELSEIPTTDWLRPPSPKNYVPFNPDNVITGQQFYPEAIGDGVAVEYTVDHGLDTDIVHVWVRENTSNGLQLVDGTDYRVRIVNANSVEIEALGGAPGVDAWLVTVVSAQTVAAFANELEIEPGQVTGLVDWMQAIEERLQDIEDLLPTTPPTRTSSSIPAGIKITLPEVSDSFPVRGSVSGGEPVPGWLLPAVHDASSSAVSAMPEGGADAHKGSVFFNDAEPAIMIPGVPGRTAYEVETSRFFASDGRCFYPVVRDASTTSYYPLEFERTLFELHINAKMLRAGMSFVVERELIAQIVRGNTHGHYVLAVEVGAPAKQESPATTGYNLSAVLWNEDSPVLAQPIILGPVAMAHPFGFEFRRDAAGDFTAQRMLYGAWEGGAQIPSAPDFSIRARLKQWDVENAPAHPRGIVSYSLTATESLIR